MRQNEDGAAMVEEGECSGDAKEEQGDVQLRGSRVVDEVSAVSYTHLTLPTILLV